MNSATHSMFSPVHERTLQTSLSLADRPKRVTFTEKYRPSLLGDILAQGSAVLEMQDFCDSPYPRNFLFHGGSGVGKTSMAFAIKAELKVNHDWNFLHIKSGELNAEALQDMLRILRLQALGDGWKMILCDEADKMSQKAKDIFLSLLEDVQSWTYGKAVIVFTTNNISAFESRFRSRCRCIEFQSAPSVIAQDAQVLLFKLWKAEGLDGTPPSVDRIPDVIDRTGDKPSMNLRVVVDFVEQECRKPRKPAEVVKADARTVKVQGRIAL